MTASETQAPLTQEFIHRVTWSDGRTEDTEPKAVRSGQPCFAGISQAWARHRDPGATVVHLVRSGGGEWETR
jgi:hypothetical protein